MIHLRSIYRKRGTEAPDRFPFTVPAVRELSHLAFSTPVTFFVGENGSGKSTLLEGIAAAARLPTVGSVETRTDATLSAQRELGDGLTLSWNRRATRGFFLRAEDFFGFTKTLARMRADFLAELGQVAEDYANASDYARRLRAGPIHASLADMERRYGVDLDANSHGQSFLKLFQSRFVPGGLYLLDEPEAPLSPQSQLGFIALMKDMLEQDAQFIIATHSPILLAFPDAAIHSFDETPIRLMPYESLEHVTLTREFLQDPERFLRHL
ncbi:MAG: AAA family ATPase [Gemmatimonadaceae bacterium]